jgi:hypothetical protein
LYLDVNNKRIGANNSAPVSDLYTPNAIDTINLIVDSAVDIGNFVLSGSTFQHLTSSITISPNQASNPTIVVPSLSTANILISGDTINNTVSNDNLNFVLTSPTTAQINLNNNTLINGNLHATGTITWDGNITLGNASTDTVSFGAEIASSIVPSVTNTYNLGTSSLTWATFYANTATVNGVSSTNLSTTNLTGSGTNNLNGNVVVGTTNTNTFNVAASFNSNIVPSATNTYNLGSSSYYWNALDVTSLTDGNLVFTSNTISPSTTNSNLVLTANGTGSVVLSSLGLSNNITAGTLNVTGTTTLNNNVSVGAITQTGNFTQPFGNTFITGTFTSAGNITGSAELFLPQVTVNNNTINVTATNTNLVLTANGTGLITFPSNNVSMSDNLSVGGTLGVTGTSSFNNVTSGAITQTGGFNQTGNTSITGTFTGTNNITGSAELILPQVTINNNSIAGTASNTNLSITASGTGTVTFPSNNVSISNNLSVSGTLGITGTSSFSNVTSGAITQTGDFNQTGNTSITGTFTGTGNITGNAELILPQVTINNNNIGGTASNTNLSISANGSGQITFPSNNVSISDNLTVSGTLTTSGTTSFGNISTGAITQTGDFNQTGSTSITGNISSIGGNITGSDTLNLGNFSIANQTITTTNTNGDATYLANGTGSVWPSIMMKINGNAIINNWVNISQALLDELGNQLVTELGDPFYTDVGVATDFQDSVVFTPTSTGKVIFSATTSVVLPSATDSLEALLNNGEIRYNSTNNNIEGYESTGYVNFIDLYSQNYQTYITGELTPAASDNILRFAINGTVTTTISSTTVTNNTMLANNIYISGNTIYNSNNSNNINFSTSGTGVVNFNGVQWVNGNNFTVPSAGPVTFNNTGTGYTKFPGTNGIVLPTGNNSNYPLSPETGTTRYNSDLGYGEVYNGTTWGPIGGSSAVLTQSQVQDAMYAWDLILG